MAGLISIGGLATGLDTNKIITQLLALERRPVDALEADIDALHATQSAVASVGSKLAALKGTASGLRTQGGVLAHQATSSDESVLTAAAGAGASRSTLTITVSQLARASTALGTVGVASSTATVAAGAGQLRFQVGAGTVQSVAVDATTTLEGLAAAINELDAGVVANALNLGTEASPDWRLHLASADTGAASTITVVQDDTQLALQTTLTGLDAQFTVSGIATPFSRATNTFSDVLGGVTVALKNTGSATVAVDDDTDTVVERVRGLVTAYNDLASFVSARSDIQGSTDGSDVKVGSLATDAAVRQLMTRLHEVISGPIGGATTEFVNLASIGVSTQQDGTLALDENALQAALAADPDAVAGVLAGVSGGDGVADSLTAWIDEASQAGGVLDTHETALGERLRGLQDQVADGERRLEKVELQLRQKFAALEKLVSGLQSQSSFLISAFGGG